MSGKKKKRKIPIDRNLTEEEVAYYYSLLNEELTDFDCGQLCAPYNDGTPYCCSSENAVPLLYKNEFKYLQKLGDLWHEWKPETKEDKELKETAGDDQIFCECKGIAHCVRDQRSITCRTFPLEPYIDRRGVFTGLTFLREFTDTDPDTGRIKCPMTRRKKDIRQEFIDSHFIFWEKMLLRKEDEYETYVDTSKALRRERTRTGRKFEVLLPSHLLESKMVKKYLY